MKFGLTRRQILNTGMAVGLGTLLAKLGYAETAASHPIQRLSEATTESEKEFSHYSRFRPSFGGPPSSDQFLGKLVRT